MELRVLLARYEALSGLEEERTAVRKRREEGEQYGEGREKRGRERAVAEWKGKKKDRG